MQPFFIGLSSIAPAPSALRLSVPSPTELSEVGGKACDAPPVAEEASRVWRSGQFFVSVSEQEKLGTTRGSVTVIHDAVGSSPVTGAKIPHSQAFRVFLLCVWVFIEGFVPVKPPRLDKTPLVIKQRGGFIAFSELGENPAFFRTDTKSNEKFTPGS